MTLSQEKLKGFACWQILFFKQSWTTSFLNVVAYQKRSLMRQAANA